MTDMTDTSPADRVGLVRSVSANWIGQMVYALSGFVLPRLVSDRIGQTPLGVWDFAWSTVALTSFLAFGVGSAASRYVAHCRAVKDWEQLNGIVNASLTVLTMAFALGLMLVGALVLLTPALLAADTDAQTMAIARWVVGVLGVSAAISLPLGLFSGFLSGYERFDLKNLTRSVCHLTGLAVMAVLLLSGYGLISLALTTLAAEVGTGLADYVLSRRLCPHLQLSPRHVRRHDIRDVLSFGGRTFLQGLARGMLYHTSGLIVAFFLGPAMLAVYSRQRALVVFAQRLLNQYANVFTPASGALHAAGAAAELRRLAIQAMRYGFYITLPMIVVLAIGGGPIVHVWMGSEYRAPLLIAILALGHLFSMAHSGAYRILIGLNQHGGVGLVELTCTVAAGAIGALFVGVLNWGLIGAALAVALGVAVNGLAPMVFLCRAMSIGPLEYLRKAMLGPLLTVLPLAVAMLAAKLFFPYNPLLELAIGLGLGGTTLVLAYWRYALPYSLKARVNTLIGRARSPGKAADQSASMGGK